MHRRNAAGTWGATARAARAEVGLSGYFCVICREVRYSGTIQYLVAQPGINPNIICYNCSRRCGEYVWFILFDESDLLLWCAVLEWLVAGWWLVWREGVAALPDGRMRGTARRCNSDRLVITRHAHIPTCTPPLSGHTAPLNIPTSSVL